jgi:hypothetical protein
MSFVNIIPTQNYFQFNQDSYEQKTDLATGAPTSAKFSEFFLQYLEHKYMLPILKKIKL